MSKLFLFFSQSQHLQYFLSYFYVVAKGSTEINVAHIHVEVFFFSLVEAL